MMAAKHGGRTISDDGDDGEKLQQRPLTERQAESQFAAMRNMLTGPGGASAEVLRIPEELRNAIRWAEEMKEKMGAN